MDIIINHARPNVGIAWIGNHVTKKTGRAQWAVSPITSNLYAWVRIYASDIVHAKHRFSIFKPYYERKDVFRYFRGLRLNIQGPVMQIH